MRIHRVHYVIAVLIVSGFIPPFLVSAQSASKDVTKADVNVLELNQQIKGKKAKIDELRKQISVYQKNISVRQQEKASLENQIALLEDTLAQTSLDIEATVGEIEQLSLQIDQATLEIQDKEEQIMVKKRHISEFIRTLYEQQQKNYLEILLLNNKFSDFFDAINGLEITQNNIKGTLVRLSALHEQLMSQKAALETDKKRQDDLKSSLIAKKEQLEEQRGTKQTLIVQSVLTAEKFQQMLQHARAEQADIDSDIAELEKTVRDKLKLGGQGTVRIAWPVDPTRGISTYFHDPSYPFRHVFEHAGLDIRAYQGSQVKAAEAGYVARIKHSGKDYSYVMILHDQGYATVYGHLNRIIVPQDTYVQKGQVIALSGGTPGTEGAGPFTTGPHLHFEVRLKGIPTDPLKYLP